MHVVVPDTHNKRRPKPILCLQVFVSSCRTAWYHIYGIIAADISYVECWSRATVVSASLRSSVSTTRIETYHVHFLVRVKTASLRCNLDARVQGHYLRIYHQTPLPVWTVAWPYTIIWMTCRHFQAKQMSSANKKFKDPYPATSETSGSTQHLLHDLKPYMSAYFVQYELRQHWRHTCGENGCRDPLLLPPPVLFRIRCKRIVCTLKPRIT